LNDVSQIAVGFGNGAVTLIRGDLINDRGTKQRTVFESQEPITGVNFVEDSRVTTLYLSTTARILTLVIQGKGQGQPAHVLEDQGCDVGCMTVDPLTGDVIVVRDDAVYSYTPHGRGPSYAIPGPKSAVFVYKEYVGTISPSKGLSASFMNIGGSQVEELLYASTLTLLDTDLKHVAQSQPFISEIKRTFTISGDLFVLTTDGKVHRLHEKPLSDKLQIMYQRNLFPQALSLARKCKLEKSRQNVIFQKYGDFLYSKNEYDGAMQQYLKAIDGIEPSQVIRKVGILLRMS
jgi:hypothetical protein